ncbi:MAG: single-stranded DNA-binding protein [Leptothrix sp. (in: b-proteobacteria)]
MSIEALILGKVHQRPEQRASNNTGRAFVTAKVLTAAGDAGGVFVNVVAFSDTVCRTLLALDVGDSVALAGTLKPGAWIDREGNARPSVDMVAAQVMTTYGLKKKRDTVAEAGEKPAPARCKTEGASLTSADDAAWLEGDR